MKRNRQEKGITLVALVIIIVVLLILGGVTIAILLSDDGVIAKARESDLRLSHATVAESISLLYTNYEIENKTSESVETDFLESLKLNGYIDPDGKVNVENVVGQKLNYGNGTGETDTYKVEGGDGIVLCYYSDATQKEILLELEPLTDENIFLYEETEKGIRITGLDLDHLECEERIIDYGLYEGEPTPSIKVNNLGTLKIPETINGKNVVSVFFMYAKLGEKSFSYITGIEKIIYPNSVKSVGRLDTDDRRSVFTLRILKKSY